MLGVWGGVGGCGGVEGCFFYGLDLARCSGSGWADVDSGLRSGFEMSVFGARAGIGQPLCLWVLQAQVVRRTAEVGFNI